MNQHDPEETVYKSLTHHPIGWCLEMIDPEWGKTVLLIWINPIDRL
jgi:hypothetical protein